MRIIRRLIAYLIIAVIVAAALAGGAYAYIYAQERPYIFAEMNDVPSVQAVLVPGAALAKGGVPSPVLQERADAAVVLYEAHKVSKILVTGDNATLEHDEVSAVRRYLEAKDIPGEDIFLDHAGFDTYSSMYRARDVFGVHTMVIVSQAFHLPRAVFIARSLGVEAYGLETATDRRYLFDTAREIPAVIKSVIDLWTQRKPRYLGDAFPISGDGRLTWYESFEIPTTTSTSTASTTRRW